MSINESQLTPVQLHLERKKLESENPQFSHYADLIQSYYNTTLRKMTHEINNSLTMIHSSLQLIQSSHPDVLSYKFWNSTMEDLDFLIDLMSDISTFNHSDMIHPRKTNLHTLLESIINCFMTCHPEVDYHLICEESIPEMNLDSIKLRQVFTNIIKNSIEACEHVKKPVLTIILTYHPASKSVDLEFQDNGCGISDSKLSSIFCPMITYKENGTGLGLAISKRIVEAHRGTISASSAEHNGTNIKIHLPA